MTVSDNIRRLRQERGLTQEELSDLLGVARSTVTLEQAERFYLRLNVHPRNRPVGFQEAPFRGCEVGLYFGSARVRG